MSEANKTQVGGGHYQNADIQHWDFVWAQDMDYFQGQVTKYVTRWKKKNGIQDLHKARHFLQKYIELVEAAQAAKQKILDQSADAEEPGRGYVSQD